MESDGVPADKIKRILEEIDLSDPFAEAREELESELSRKKYLKKEFAHAAPISVRLNTDNLAEKPETMQYVPIKESLKILLEDDTFLRQKATDPYFPEENIVKDCRDGLTFQQNEFFKQNPTSVPLVIFQDELEVVNPLGPESQNTRSSVPILQP